MYKELQTASYLHAEFTDPQAYTHMLTDSLGLRAHSIQLSHGPTSTAFDLFCNADNTLRIGRSRIRQSDYIDFEIPAGYTMVSTSLGGLPYFCNGMRVLPVQATVYPGGYRYSGAYPAGWETIDVIIDNKFARSTHILRTDLMRASRSLEFRAATDQGRRMTAIVESLLENFSRADQWTKPIKPVNWLNSRFQL